LAVAGGLVGGPFGSNLGRRDYHSEGVPVIRGANLGNGRFTVDDLVFVLPEKADRLKSNLALPGDIVVTQRGTLGQVARIPERHFDRWVVSQSQMALRVDPEAANPSFVFWALRGPDLQHQIQARAIATGVPHINLGIFGDLDVMLPDREHQSFAAEVLDAIDGRIETSRQVAALAENLATAIFRSWFVDFDPVRAKAAGEVPAGVPEDAVDLFPDRLIDSEIGPIPQGWQIVTLAMIAEQKRESQKAAEANPRAPYVGLDHMVPGETALFDWGKRSDVSGVTTHFAAGDVLFGKLRPYFRKVVVAPLDGTCSKEILVLSPISDADFGLLLGHVGSQDFIDYCDRISTGTRMPRAEWKVASEWKLARPPDALSAQFTRLTKALYTHVQSLINESRSLAELRDALLPELVSGRLRVPPDSRHEDGR
jgi:type I restriction enzyme S subunit